MVRLVDIELMIRGLKEDRKSGASELAAKALSIVEDLVRSADKPPLLLIKELKDVGDKMVNAQPTMATIKNVISKLIARAERIYEEEPYLLKDKLLSNIRELRERIDKSMSKIPSMFSNLVRKCSSIATISYSKTVYNVILHLHKHKLVNHVLVSESRPLYEGRYLAEDLSKKGVNVTLITDASIGYFLDISDMALVGADAVLTTGHLVNKVGTYLLALSCKHKGKPFYVACESIKVLDIAVNEIKIKEMDREEIVKDEVPFEVKNVYFDVTPPELIDAIITESGIYSPTEIKNALDPL